MAVDAALLAHARRTGEVTLRTYEWSQRTLSLGRHERARGFYDADRLAQHGVDVVRRPTGGRALLHHRELTYSVTAPCHGASLAESYRAINTLLLAALSQLGVEVSESPRSTRSLRPEGAACFAEPSAGELVWRGAKLAGSAQLREDGALLQHGAILIEDDQALISALRTGEATPVGGVARVATLRDALGKSVAPSEVSDALQAALANLLGAPGPIPALDPAFLRPDLARLEGAFRDPAWTWRR